MKKMPVTDVSKRQRKHVGSRNGLRMKALLMRVGAVPPPAGAVREQFLLHEGQMATRAVGAALSEVLVATASVLGEEVLPLMPDPLAVFDLAMVEQRLTAWERLRMKLVLATPPVPRWIVGVTGPEPMQGEAAARTALRHAMAAYHYLAETDRAQEAHRRLHRVGELVGGLYGCWANYDHDDRLWYDVCPVRLAHIPYGISPGFTARRLCSVCEEDISECEHLPGNPYPVVAARRADKCSVCRSQEACEHEPGVVYQVDPHPVLTDPRLHEGSFVPTPRDPLARVTAIEIREPPPIPTGSRDLAERSVRCRFCQCPCPADDDEHYKASSAGQGH